MRRILSGSAQTMKSARDDGKCFPEDKGGEKVNMKTKLTGMALCALLAAPVFSGTVIDHAELTRSSLTAIEEWAWNSTQVEPDYLRVMVTPVVADLDNDGIPEIIFNSYKDKQSYNTDGILRAVIGNSGKELFSINLYRTVPTSTPAVGNIDLDDEPEIVVLESGNRNLLAFENDGTFKWRSATVNMSYGNPAIADLDQDGKSEIIVGNTVFDNNGALLDSENLGTGLGLSCVANIDLNGNSEIVAGNTVYEFDGPSGTLNVRWHRGDLDDGYNAIGNFDGDNFAEIVLVCSGMIYLLEHDGSEKWSRDLPEGGGGGPPTIEDFNGDGLPDIGVATKKCYVVFQSDLSELWRSERIKESSSGITSSTVFDLNADGTMDVIYNDERNLWIFDGSNGAVQWFTPNPSYTAIEMPVIADVDNDGRAEIVVACNPNGLDPSGDFHTGIRVFGSTDWVNVRKIWNQHTYHITNVDDDGSVPMIEGSNWLIFNNYRVQKSLMTVGCFCATYRNFNPEDRTDFGEGAGPTSRKLGLIEKDLPWRPSPLSVSVTGFPGPSPRSPPNWYTTPSCVFQIDPSVPWGTYPLGLYFPDIYSFPPELDQGFFEDPFCFTVHWETTITVQDADVTFYMFSDDDSWLFVDDRLEIDLGGMSAGNGTSVQIHLNGVFTIDIFYAERYDHDPDPLGAEFKFGIFPGPPTVIVNCPLQICAKKSFEDLLRYQAETIQSFENLLNELDNPNFDQMKSFEDLLREQEELLISFEQLIKGEVPSEDAEELSEGEYLFEAEFIILLDSFEDLLDRQCVLIKSFEHLLNISKEGLTLDDFSELLFSFEDLIKSQEQLLTSFEDLLETLFNKYGLATDQKYTFLESFEDLLTCQYELIESFADILIGSEKKFLMAESSTLMPEFAELIFSLEDLIRSQYKLLESFDNLLQKQLPEMNQEQRNIFLKSFEDLLLNQSELLRKFEDLLKLTEGAWIVSGNLHSS
ncbi:MAG: FG-GAP-like repeat-containing protein [Candidatus Methanofastidiosia archaeon]